MLFQDKKSHAPSSLGAYGASMLAPSLQGAFGASFKAEGQLVF